MQRYSWTWTGDVNSDWDALKITMPTIMGLGLSGIPYSGSDIGGFQGNPSAELYLRWFQMATFHTFYRTHSSNNVANRTPWYYGEPYLSIMRQFLELRYRLMPYIYTLSWEAAQKGYPPVRPLFWCNPDDSQLWNVDDAFLLGDALLICPITEAGARSRQVILPEGHWYSFWDDAIFIGGQQVVLQASLEQIPVLVKAGNILPMEEDKKLVLHIYPPVTEVEETENNLYIDAGDGYGEWRLDQFQLMLSQNNLELFWKQQGEYAFPYDSVQLHLHGVELLQSYLDNKEVMCQGNVLECDRFTQAKLKIRQKD